MRHPGPGAVSRAARLHAALLLLALAGAVEARAATSIVPDRFLRRWDPVTVFFDAARGPAAGGPEDDPSQFATISPEQPGAWSWIDARTLQFRPADPWPPFTRVEVRAGGASAKLATLLGAPLSSQPGAGTEGLPPVDEIALTFAEPLPPAALAQAVTIEHRALPGLGDGGGDGATLRLGEDDFEIVAMERGAPSEPATYRLLLKQPIPTGRKVLVRFRLSLDEIPGSAFHEIAFATAEPFRVVRFGCRRAQLPAVSTGSGARYAADQALACEESDPAVVVEFSAAPKPVDPSVMRNLVRLSPPVEKLDATISGKRLELRGAFARDVAYRLALAPAAIADERGRALELAAPNELTLGFPRATPYLRWGAASGIVERKGPRMAPVVGRGDQRVDLRIHRIDPLDRSFWPFPEEAVAVDEDARPPGPGEAPAPFTRPDAEIGKSELVRQIAALPAPAVSAIVELPLRRDGASASFGLDLGPPLGKLGAGGAPGTYLVGLRRLGASGERSYLRLQVTDLALSTLEEPERTLFLVTSLADARPLAGAEVRVDGVRRIVGEKPEWLTLWSGTTDAEGKVEWKAPGLAPGRTAEVKRLVVSLGDDRLVLDPGRGPDVFADNRWNDPSEYGDGWLQWTQESLDDRKRVNEWLAHLFVDRPVYRPEDPVRIKGYLREREGGRLEPLSGDGVVVIEGPGDLVWRYEVEVAENGSFDIEFDEEELPTGTYRVAVELYDYELQGGASFRKEAYRLPKFEVRLDAPARAALDEPFQVDLAATYYAGGRVAARPVEWRVTQFPYDWTPPARPGFFFASDGRFSRVARFESTPALERADSTDENGGAALALDPTIEPTAQPRSYVVEATVVGADDQTVTATRSITALPPFLLGVKVPRYLERAAPFTAELVAIGPDDKARAGQELTVRLIRRRWHAHLRASDVTDGVARYVTEVVDEPVLTREVRSAAEPVKLELPISEAGVYVVELSGHDRMGRAQTVAVDLFAGGDKPVSWERPAASVFQVSPDKAKYAPGETAKLVLESPFQNGEALAAIEAPDGFTYRWLPVRGGKATFELPIQGHWAPRMPVHFLLMRGRLDGAGPVPGNATDIGRPATFGATAWLDVEPVDNRLVVELEAPPRAQPGQEIEVVVKLADPAGAPLPGEVTLWLVDQAVLALGKEARLDPLPSFLTSMVTLFTARDTRSLIFGFLPFVERPGGDGGEESRGPLDRQTVRKNFRPVPFYEPSIEVGPDGVARVRVKLSDDLTNFKLRAKAISGAERFGFATGHLEVRQPVILDPVLPRFVRPGDRLLAGAIGRVVEGAGGAGSIRFEAEGADFDEGGSRPIEWVANRTARVDVPVTVPTPGYTADGNLARTEVVFRAGAERAADKAGDAWEIRLPIADDRERAFVTDQVELASGAPWKLPEPSEAARAGSLRRELLVSTQPGILELAAGLDFLLEYPYGCTEQRLATARVAVALRRLRAKLGLTGGEARLERAIGETLEWLPQVEQADGRIAFWPGSDGSVALTAWTGEFLAEAREAKVEVDGELVERVARTLTQALRSDYAGFVSGSAWAERTWALRGLARLGKFDAAYGNELARRAQFLNLEGMANVVVSFDRAGLATAPALAPLGDELARGVVVRLSQGRETYGGLQSRGESPSGLLLPSEARTLAEMIRALAIFADKGAHDGEAGARAGKLELMTTALVARGQRTGWGSTNANAAAMLALAERIEKGGGSAAAELVVSGAGRDDARLAVGGSNAAAASWIDVAGGAAEVAVASAESTVGARVALSYLPSAPGSQAAARGNGFAVNREALLFRAQAASGAPPERLPIAKAGERVALAVGDVVEEHVRVASAEDRFFVAVTVPLAAGMEPLNPQLETAPPEATPQGRLTLEPTFAAYLDDRVAYYFNELPKGSYDFYFRTRAQIAGEFVQPPARAEMMYDAAVVGTSPGAVVRVESAPAPR